MLTGKAKEDFKKWLSEESEKYHQHEWLDNDMYLDEIWLPPPIENSLIIEFFDSVGIYIEIGVYPSDGTDPNFTLNYSYAIFGLIGLDGDLFTNRQEATKAAIEQANKIYNER